MAPTHVLIGDIPVYADDIISVSEIHTNYPRIFSCLKPYAEGRRVYLPLEEWRLLEKVRIWFDIHWRGSELRPFTWEFNVPEELHGILNNMQRQYNGVEVLPNLSKNLVNEMMDEMRRFKVDELYSWRYSSALDKHSQFNTEWKKALEAIPREPAGV